ncbi:dipeptidase [Clostridium folliculivorans]|uniref:Peptidase n=1 Tax=Clostridium folliculivorans TaxID=2886038 RepID=A0A9W5XZI9_9CLOT|nr:dipeptidase [Clostridium folliculivorans]GKU23863.1 peptidase [Clostridium folliculivorans]GKU29979.1 peptidase [Clostridium folliculivorans]
MNFIDLHCDTALKLFSDRDAKLRENQFSVDIMKLKAGNAKAQFFALFLEKDQCGDLKNDCIDMYKRLVSELDENKSDIALVRNYDQYLRCQNENKLGAFITIEEGGAIAGDINNLQEFYDMGIRLITLTWNFENEIGYPHCKKEYADKGLKPFGIEVVKKMNELGIIIDVSHLSDGGFFDVAKCSTKPFVASHSNSRAIRNHTRNLTDEMIKILSTAGGVMGINFCSGFVGKSKTTKIDDMVEHINHIRKIGGIDCIALGSDFDGIENEVEIKDASEMGKLADALVKNNFSYDDVEKIFYKNAERIIREVL